MLTARIGRKKPPLKVLWARYLNTVPQGSERHYRYERFCQIIAEHARARDLTRPLTHEPGHISLVLPLTVLGCPTAEPRDSNAQAVDRSRAGVMPVAL